MDFSTYLEKFDYQERSNMRTNIDGLMQLLKLNQAQVIDIRFTDEAEAWGFDFITNIPINELPSRLDELDKNKTIITVCPHSDRSSLARHFLTLKGFNCKYLSDGLVGLASHLRGGAARDFVKSLNE